MIRYRSPEPILLPRTQAELSGVADNVAFPTGTDQRLDLGQSHRIDVYYGMVKSIGDGHDLLTMTAWQWN